MKSKLLLGLFVITLSITILGCGKKSEVISEENEKSFSLITDNLTIECGTPLESDVSKYVQADNVQNITMITPDSSNDWNNIGRSPISIKINFTDISTQDTLSMIVNFVDTKKPEIKIEGEAKLDYYRLEHIGDYSATNEAWQEKIIVRSKIDEDEDYSGYIRISDGKIQCTKNSVEYNKLEYTISDDPIFESVKTIPGYQVYFDSNEKNNLIGLTEAPKEGTYTYNVYVEDNGNNIGTTSFELNVINDIDPDERTALSVSMIDTYMLLDSSISESVLNETKIRFGDKIVEELKSLIDFSLPPYERQMLSDEDIQKTGNEMVDVMIKECNNN